MKQSVVIIGAGLAGSLLGIYLARKNLSVEVYERRGDMRTTDVGGGRSINLALSVRGIHALQEVGLAEKVLRIAIPMRGRMVHPVSGEVFLQRYGIDEKEVIYAVSRAELNKFLMNAAEKHKNLHITFNTRCTGMNLETGEVYLVHEQTGDKFTILPKTVIGADGSASAIRTTMVEKGISTFTLEYLEYGYKELTIPPAPNGKHRIEKNALHIWPRTTYMLIALPNLDGSFTCTFFFPHKGEMSFESLDTEERVFAFFKEHFPDVVPLMPGFVQEFLGHPTGSMVTVKGLPWHVDGKVLLLGDAAHAIVPFFGQGMNCAFEDCTYLNLLLERQMSIGRSPEKVRWDQLYPEFEKMRKKETDAIADLAVENFVEMRDHVARARFQLKKQIERMLAEHYPGLFIPKYTMVTFRRIPYSVAQTRGAIQEQILDQLSATITRLEDLDLHRADVLISKHLDYIE